MAKAKQKKPTKRKAKKVVLLSGGNPQIAKGDGDAPVQAYIKAMPGWKRALGKRLDALIVKAVPHVQKAVKWNSPMYGVADQGFFLGMHVFTRYVKLAFFRGTLLEPVPPGPSKHEETRYLDIHEDDELDEKQLESWFKQAAAIPGWKPGGEKMQKKANGESPSKLIDAKIKELGDWRGTMLGRIRKLIKEADPEVVEEVKWRGVPVWSHDGIICTGETYKNYVKMTFAKGASLDDPKKLFNSSLEGNTRRAIDFAEGAKIDEKALKTLIRDAVALNKKD